MITLELYINILSYIKKKLKIHLKIKIYYNKHFINVK